MTKYYFLLIALVVSSPVRASQITNPASATTTAPIVGSFTSSGSTGNQAVTGVGFRPSVVMFYINLVSSGNSFYSSGRMDSAGHQSVEMWAIGTAVNLNTTNTTACIGLQSNSSATFVSMDADGFTINWASANAQVIHYAAFP